MPVGGGTFTVQNKILPGAYYQFRASGNTVSMGARGIAALPWNSPGGLRIRSILWPPVISTSWP